MLLYLKKQWHMKTKRPCLDVFNRILHTATPITTVSTSRKSIRQILNGILVGELKIDVALHRFIQILDEKTNINDFEDMAQFFFYFIVCIILENKNRSNYLLISNKLQKVYENNGNTLLQMLLHDFLPHLCLQHIKLEYFSQKTNAITECVHIDIISQLIIDYMDYAMYDFIKFIIHFWHYVHKQSYFYIPYDNELNFAVIVFEIASQNLFCDDNNIIIWSISRVLLHLLYENDKKPYKYLSLLVNKYHPKPFYKYPQYWMDLIRFVLNDNEEEISLFFHRVFYSDINDGGSTTGFFLFYPCGCNEGYDGYQFIAIDYANESPKYEYIYHNIICKYLLNDLNAFHWFLIEFTKHCITLWQYQKDINNYSESAFREFILFFLRCVDNRDGIATINTLYPKSVLHNPLYMDFAHKMGVSTFSYHFKMAMLLWRQQVPHYKDWQDFVAFICVNEWAPGVDVH